MKKKDVVVGAWYMVKVSGREVSVRIDRTDANGGWWGTSMFSMRVIRIKTAGRLRRPSKEYSV